MGYNGHQGQEDTLIRHKEARLIRRSANCPLPITPDCGLKTMNHPSPDQKLNGIVLVSFINELRNKGLSVAEAVRRGTELRLRPVLKTASVTILGLIPMLLSSGEGAETQRPLAAVVVGGLITSTLLTLVLLPVIYEWLESRGEKTS